MKKRDIFMNKPLYLGQAILDYSKMLMYEFWYDYLRPKYGDKIKLCYMDTDTTNCRFDTSNYSKDINRPLEKK